ncbi:MAG: hypothetical protein P8099_14010 [Gemmatimonadota bacterium]
MNQVAMDRIQRETFRELHRDGLTEVVAGVALFVVALATGRPAFYWTYLALIVILGPGLTRLRARYTYPRIGFAELTHESRRRLSRGIVVWVVGVALAVTAVLAVLGKLGNNLAWRRAAPLLGGLLFAGGLLYLAQRSGLKRVYGLAVASIITGALLTWPEIEGAYANLRVWALLMALLCLAVGGLAFRRFVRETPVAEDWNPDVG